MAKSCSRKSSSRAAALEEVVERLQRLVGQRDDEVGPDEDVELGGVQPADRLVVAREVQDDEQVVVVLVDLRALVAAEDVLVVERVEVEVLLEPGAVDRARALDVDPAQAGGLELLDVRGLRLSGPGDAVRARPCPAAQWPGQARHGDFAARRSASIGSACRGMCTFSAHSWTHPEGWRDWPVEAPATTRPSRRERCQFLIRCGGASRGPRHDESEDQHMAAQSPAVQGVQDRVPARRAVRLRAVLRPARGRLRARARPRRRRGAPPHPGRPAEHLALRGLPAARGAARPVARARPRASACPPAARR